MRVISQKTNMFDVRDTRLIRLQDPETGEFLHWNGVLRVPNEENAWLGYQYQAQNLADRNRIAGRGFPFEIVGRVD